MVSGATRHGWTSNRTGMRATPFPVVELTTIVSRYTPASSAAGSNITCGDRLPTPTAPESGCTASQALPRCTAAVHRSSPPPQFVMLIVSLRRTPLPAAAESANVSGSDGVTHSNAPWG